MKKTSAVVAMAVIVGLTLAACGNDDDGTSGASALDLSGLTFLGDTVTVDDAPYALVPGSTVRLSFDDSQITASAGCNTMSGPASWSDGTLTLDGGLAMTEMGCRPKLMDQDTWLADLLSSSPILTLDGQTLTVANDTTVLTLTDEEVAVPDASLTGTRWLLESILEGETVSSVPAGVTASVVFSDKGSVNAELGCNLASGGYSVDGQTLQIGPLASTLKACDETTTAVENAMLAVLDGESSYAIDGDQLTLTPSTASSGGSTGLVFNAAVD